MVTGLPTFADNEFQLRSVFSITHCNKEDYMTGRLSEANLTSTLDGGHKSLPWEAGQPSGFLAGIDFDAILQSPEAKQIIQSLPTQVLYYGLKRKGMAECIDVLPHLAEEQVTRLADYDLWYKDSLVPQKAFELLGYFGEHSSEQLYKRFSFLEEEYQLSILGGLIRVYELEEFEAMSQEQQDQLFAMPCNEIYYSIETDDQETISFIQKLMAALTEHNLRYAYSLVSHVSYGLKSENEEAIRRFRTCRLEEDGFVSYEDSLSCFVGLDFLALREKWAQGNSFQGAVTAVHESRENYLNRVLDLAQASQWTVDEQYEVHQQLLYLANSLCSAAQVEPEDLYGLNRVLEQCRAVVGLGLEYLSGSDLQLGLKVLKGEHVKNLFRTGISLVQDLRKKAIARLVEAGLPEVDSLSHGFATGRHGQILKLIDQNLLEHLGFESCEILKGLFNRFPMAPDFSEAKGQIRFVPIACLPDFETLRDYVLGLSVLLFLGDMAKQGEASESSLQTVLSTSMLRAMSSGEFTFKAVEQSMGDDFLKLSKQEIHHKRDAFITFVMSSLVEKSPLWDLGFEHVTRVGIEKGLYLFEDLTEGLFTAHGDGRLPRGLIQFKES